MVVRSMIKRLLITGTQSVLNRLSLVTLVILCLDQVEELVHTKQNGVESHKRRSVIVCTFITARKNLGQGNIFTSMSFLLSTGDGGWLPSMHHRSHDQGGLPPGALRPGGVDPGVVCLQGVRLSRGLHPWAVCI